MPCKFMAVSLANIPKDSQVLRFITAGHPGRCKLCGSFVQKLEAHHVCYSPESTIKLCHNCHHKVHFWPNRLSEPQKIILLQKRFSPREVQEIMSKKMLGFDALAKLIAPSRSAFVRLHQLQEKKALRKVNKESAPSN